MQIDDIYISFTIRYLKNEISEKEKTELFDWVYEKEENEKLFYHLKDMWETAQFEHISKNANTEAEWEKLVLTAIKQESDYFQEKKTKSRTIYRAIQIAALVVIALGVGFFVQKFIPEESNYASVTVPYGAKSELELPDGSKVWVNSGSKIKYPTNVNSKEVNLYLEGEAYFDIVKNPKRTLNVKTSTINIQVHGTTFNVKSYNDEDVVETTLLEGSISITGSVGNKVIKTPIFLKPNEQATLIKSEKTLDVSFKDEQLSKSDKKHSESTDIVQKKSQPRLQIKEGINSEEFVLWKYNVLSFKNERFEELAISLERWYNVEISIEDQDLKNSRYTGTFEKETIEQAMDALSLSLPFTYKIDKNRITIINSIK